MKLPTEHSLTPDGSPTVLEEALETARALLLSGCNVPKVYIRFSGSPTVTTSPTMGCCVIVSRQDEPVFKYGLDSQLPLHIIAWLDNAAVDYITDVLDDEEGEDE